MRGAHMQYIISRNICPGAFFNKNITATKITIDNGDFLWYF